MDSKASSYVFAGLIVWSSRAAWAPMASDRERSEQGVLPCPSIVSSCTRTHATGGAPPSNPQVGTPEQQILALNGKYPHSDETHGLCRNLRRKRICSENILKDGPIFVFDALAQLWKINRSNFQYHVTLETLCHERLWPSGVTYCQSSQQPHSLSPEVEPTQNGILSTCRSPSLDSLEDLIRSLDHAYLVKRPPKGTRAPIHVSTSNFTIRLWVNVQRLSTGEAPKVKPQVKITPSRLTTGPVWRY